jgi:hypothetical protein
MLAARYETRWENERTGLVTYAEALTVFERARAKRVACEMNDYYQAAGMWIRLGFAPPVVWFTPAACYDNRAQPKPLGSCLPLRILGATHA